MVINFKRISEYLDFKEGCFYYVMLLSRKKDNPEAKSTVFHRSFCIDDEEYYWKIKDKIIEYCDYFNARAYISLNRKNYKDIATKQFKLIAEYFDSGDYKAMRKVFDSVAGKYHSAQKRKWIIDFDGLEAMENVKIAQTYIDELHGEIKKKDYQSYGVIPTPNGLHLISEPFNSKKFNNRFPNYEIKKNGLTILCSI